MRSAKQLWFSIVLALLVSGAVNAQTQTTTAAVSTAQAIQEADTIKVLSEASKPESELVAATNQSRTSREELLRAQQAELNSATAKIDELRQLVAEGLVARIELEESELALTRLQTNLENTRKNIATSSQLAADLKTVRELAQSKPMGPKPMSVNTRSFLKPTILRYSGISSWSLTNLGKVQSFFAASFGQSLPVSALGQSATHNRLGYDHRNAVDVPLHPDSAQGKALIDYLQRQGIPFLAFRAAVPGVATGPHIHIGSPSNRLG